MKVTVKFPVFVDLLNLEKLPGTFILMADDFPGYELGFLYVFFRGKHLVVITGGKARIKGIEDYPAAFKTVVQFTGPEVSDSREVDLPEDLIRALITPVKDSDALLKLMREWLEHFAQELSPRIL